MPTQVQFRRGTTVQNNNFTGAAGELSFDTQVKTIRVHDGSVAGGTILAKSSDLTTANVSEVSNLYFSNARATVAVINSSLSNVTVTGNVVTGNVIISTSGGVQFSDGSTQTTAAGARAIGFTNSTVSAFPGSSVNTDYGDLLTSSTDAFNVALSTAYDCMEPRGSITTADLAVF